NPIILDSLEYNAAEVLAEVDETPASVAAALAKLHDNSRDTTFVFPSIEDADGQLIVVFGIGDKIDLSGIDANTTLEGDQPFQLLLEGDVFSGLAGDLVVRWETDGSGGNFTVIEGDVDGDGAADLRIDIVGNHQLDEASFVL